MLFCGHLKHDYDHIKWQGVKMNVIFKKTPSFPLIEVDNENFRMGVEGLVKEQCEFDLVVNALVGIKNTIKKLVNID